MLTSERLKQFRLAKGMSLDDLAQSMDGFVTKQSLSKYERGASLPSKQVIEKLAEALNVSIESLSRRATVEIEIVEYRKGSRLRKHEQNRIESLCQFALEERIRLLDMLGEFNRTETLPEPQCISNVEEAEGAAFELRNHWRLGTDPIPSMVNLLENKQIHVIEIDATEGFDGLSLRALNSQSVPVSSGVVSRRGLSGDRQRLNLAHELGHLVLSVESDDYRDKEKVAYRFGGAFLAPSQTLFRDIGRRRTFISSQELFLLKRRYGMSIQALLYRLRELEVINHYLYKKWCIMIGKMGWRKKEPQQLAPEIPQRLDLLIHRAFIKGLLPEHEALQILRLGHSDQEEITLVEKDQFMSMNESDHRALIEKQVKELESSWFNRQTS